MNQRISHTGWYPGRYPDLQAEIVNQSVAQTGRYPGRYPDLQAEILNQVFAGYRKTLRYPGRYPDLEAGNWWYPAHSLWRYIILYRGWKGVPKG